MAELYCSWCAGLAESKKALNIIKDSNEFMGIESSNTDFGADKILDAGLKISIHNPAREHKISIESPNFLEAVTGDVSILDSCRKSSLPFVSFHAGHHMHFHKPVPAEYILSNTKKNLRYLDNELDKMILLEELWLPFEKTQLNSTAKESVLYSTSIDYMKDILSSTNAGILLDISHTLVTASARIKSRNYLFDEKNYFMDTLNAVSKSVFEAHINCPQFTKADGFVDKHFPFKSNGVESRTVFECAAEAIAVCSNLKTITLEIEPHVDPVKHARLMVKQAKLFRKKITFN